MEKKPLDHIRIVLVKPQHGGNVGSVCRAMKNMGLSRLVLVDPPNLNKDELRKMSMTAIEVYENRVEAPTLGEAVADCVCVGATSARRGFYRHHALDVREFASEALESTARGEVALVFGPEDSGLCNDDLKQATHIVCIPSSPEYQALNLSKAVMVAAYELYVAAGDFQPPEESVPDATHEFRERMFTAWSEAMIDTGFCKDDKLEHMMMGLRRILTRGRLSEPDVKILLGLARQAQWAAKHGRADGCGG